MFRQVPSEGFEGKPVLGLSPGFFTESIALAVPWLIQASFQFLPSHHVVSSSVLSSLIQGTLLQNRVSPATV